MQAGNRAVEIRTAWLGRVVTRLVATGGIAGVIWLLAIGGAAGADPSASTRTEPWGPQQGDLRTRLVPLADQFTLGQPMRLRLELKNVGRTVVHYDPQQVDINGSLSVRDPQGHAVRYAATSFQTAGGEEPALTPGNVVCLFDHLDLDSQYLIVKPGKYSVQFCGYGFPKSNSIEIDVRPGTLPPIKRIAARLLDLLPKDWGITVHGYPGESDHSRAFDWDGPPPGWEAARGLPTIELIGNRSKEGSVRAHLWLSNRELPWSGKVDAPGQTAASYYGKCPEGYVYATLPSGYDTAAAQWPAFERDFQKALRAERENTFAAVGQEIKTDDDLKRLKDLAQRDSLILDNTGVSDAGLKYLEGSPRLKSLWLRYTGITDQGLKSLGKLPRLEHVWLDGDPITDAGLENLKGLAQLEGLSLYGTKITDAGMEKLKGLTRLQHLSLGHTAITDAGLKTVKGFAHLRTLELGGTRITDDGLQWIEGLTEIQRLSLAKTRITDAGLIHLKPLACLTSLDLDESHVTDEGVTRLQQELPRCKLLYRSEENRRKQLQAMEDRSRRGQREASAISRIQAIAGSRLCKHYIVQFDKPGLERQPVLVIVWKAKGISISLGRLNTEAPVVEINGHLITPPRTKQGVYALQPDYSLQRLSLTEAEISRLLLHIVRSEQRAVSADEVQTLPSDPYWEEKVDPHLKVVEPEKTE